MSKSDLVVIAHDIRSSYNVGSLMRSCAFLGVSKLYLSGITPYPLQAADERIGYLADKITRRIYKTSLGSENYIETKYVRSVTALLIDLRSQGYSIVGLDQTAGSIDIRKFKPASKLVLILGREKGGIDKKILSLCQYVVEIPGLGQKDSLNVSVAAAIAIFWLKYS